MKLVIDISEYDYEWMRNLYAVPDKIRTEIAEKIINGTPFDSVIEEYVERGAITENMIMLDKIDSIKAEIEQILQEIDTVSHNEYENAVEQGKEIAYENVLSILDNIGKAESEESK